MIKTSDNEVYDILLDIMKESVFIAYYMTQEPGKRLVKKFFVDKNFPADKTLKEMSKISNKSDFLFWLVSPEGLKYLKDNEKPILFSMKVNALHSAGYSTEEITRIVRDEDNAR